MTPPDRQLLHHLVLAIAVKLAALLLLWALFVRGAGLAGDPAEAFARRPGPPAPERIRP